MWLTLAFLSALTMGLYDVFKKITLADNNVAVTLWFTTLFSSLVFLIPAVLSLTSHSYAFIEPWQFSRQSFLMLKALIVLSSWLLSYLAIKHLPLTIVGPINATRPIFTLLGAMLILGERLNPWQWAGVLLAIFAFFLLARTGRREGIRFSRNPWIFSLVGAALLGACSGLYDKFLMTRMGFTPLTVQAWYNFYQFLLMSLMLAVFMGLSRHTSLHPLGHTPFTFRATLPFISLSLALGDFLYFQALTDSDALIAVVSMIRRGSVLVSFLFGVFLFREAHAGRKALDLLFVALGLVCLYIGSR